MIKNVVSINLMKQKISVIGAKNNNLKNIDAQIPWHSLYVCNHWFIGLRKVYIWLLKRFTVRVEEDI